MPVKNFIHASCDSTAKKEEESNNDHDLPSSWATVEISQKITTINAYPSIVNHRFTLCPLCYIKVLNTLKP